MASYNLVSTRSSEIPNRNDNNQWLAGGTLKNEGFPGGSLWSPTSVPNFNIYDTASKNTALLNGELLSFLGGGISTIANVMSSWNLNLMFDERIRQTDVVRITIVVTDSFGNTVYQSEKETDGSESDYSALQTINESTQTLKDIETSWKNRTDVVNLVNSNPLSIAANVYNMATQKEVTIESTIQSAVIGTVMSQLSSGLTNAVVSALGITSPIGAMAIGGVIGAVLSELAEMAMGLDNSFGWGGEIIGTDMYGAGVYQDKTISGSLESSVKGFFGMDYNVSGTLSDIDNNVIGGWQEYQVDNWEVIGSWSDVSTYDDTGWTVTDEETGTVFETNSTGDYSYTSDGYTVEENSDGGYDVTNNDTGNTTSTDSDGNVTSTTDWGGQDPDSFENRGTDNYSSRNESSSSSNSSGGGTYCCTKMKDHNKWKAVMVVRMEKWHSKQSPIWIKGYDIWGKVVANKILKEGNGITGKMMNAFYDRKIHNKPITKHTIMAYCIIYPGVYVAGIYSLAESKLKSLTKN